MFLFVVLVSFIYFSGVNVTGRAIYHYGGVGECSESEIRNLWDTLFYESSEGISILLKNEDLCGEYIAYKILGDNEIYYLVYSNEEGSKIEKVSYLKGYASRDSMYEFGSGRLIGANELVELINEYSEVGNYEDLYNLFIKNSEEELLTERSIDIEGARNEFREVFKKGVCGNLSLLKTKPTNYYSALDIEWKEKSHNTYDNYNIADGVHSEYNHVIRSFLYNEYRVVEKVVLEKQIPDLEFNKDSGWEVGFHLDNHFDNLDGVEFSFYKTGKNNSDGKFINFSIDGMKVLFKPREDWLGSKLFKIKADSPFGPLYSNTFNVSIKIDANDAPYLEYEISNIIVPKGKSVTVPLIQYFDDPDGDDLKYRAEREEGIIVKFDNNDMILSIGRGFDGAGMMRVYASDGKLEAKSNVFYVFEGKVDESLVLKNNSEKEESWKEKKSLLIDEKRGESIFLSNSSLHLDRGGFVYGVVVPLTILIIIGVIVSIYFLIRRVVVSKKKRPSQDLVSEYLKELES